MGNLHCYATVTNIKLMKNFYDVKFRHVQLSSVDSSDKLGEYVIDNRRKYLIYSILTVRYTVVAMAVVSPRADG